MPMDLKIVSIKPIELFRRLGDADIEVLATLENAKGWRETYEKFVYCIDLLEISAHSRDADHWVNALEDRFESLLGDV